jgi:hypothetical protein
MNFLNWCGKTAGRGMETLQLTAKCVCEGCLAIFGVTLIVATLLFLMVSAYIGCLFYYLLFVPAFFLGLCVKQKVTRTPTDAYGRGNCKTCKLRQ